MTNNFRFLNLNPKREITEDCVCRAIAGATNQDYYSVDRQLNQIAREYQCPKLCVCCYENLLEEKYGLPKYNGGGMRVIDVARTTNKAIVRIQGHLTFCKNGKIYDLWDCSLEKVNVYWVLE